MSSLVKVRGKRKTSSHQTSKTGTKQSKVGNGLGESKKKQHELSRLEALPIEVLEKVYLTGTNLNLHLVSRTLYNKLSSEHLKTELVIGFFSASGAWDTQYLTAGQYSQFNIVESSVVETTDDTGSALWYTRHDFEPDSHDRSHIALVQSILLRQRWLDYAFFKQCRWNFYKRKALLQLRHFIGTAVSSGEKNRQLDRLQHVLESCLRRWDEFEIIPDEVLQISGDYSYARPTDGKIFSAIVNHEYGDCTSVELISDDKAWTRQIQKESHIPARGWLHHAFPQFEPSVKIPNYLYGRPWTQANGEFLKLLMDSIVSAGFIPDIPDQDVLENALTHAIEDECIPAIRLLLLDDQDQPLDPHTASCVGLQDMFTAGEVREKTSKSWSGLFDRSKSTIANGGIYTSIDKPWTFLTGRRLQSIHDFAVQHRALEQLSVLPTAAQLTLSLDVAARCGDSDIKLFKWLALEHDDNTENPGQMPWDNVTDYCLEMTSNMVGGGEDFKKSAYVQALEWMGHRDQAWIQQQRLLAG